MGQRRRPRRRRRSSSSSSSSPFRGGRNVEVGDLSVSLSPRPHSLQNRGSESLRSQAGRGWKLSCRESSFGRTMVRNESRYFGWVVFISFFFYFILFIYFFFFIFSWYLLLFTCYKIINDGVNENTKFVCTNETIIRLTSLFRFFFFKPLCTEIRKCPFGFFPSLGGVWEKLQGR